MYSYLWDITLARDGRTGLTPGNLDVVFPLPRLGQIVGGLPSQPEFRVGPARFLQANGHLRGNRRVSIQKRVKGCEIIPCARALGISVNAYSPLAGGFLTGKYTRGDSTESRRFDNEFWQQLAFQLDERAFDIARKVPEIADRLGTSSAAVALAWVRDRGVLPMIGARKVSQLEDSLRYLSLTLPDEDMQALNEASAPVLPWTYHLLHSGESRIRHLAAGGMLDAIDNEHFPF